MPDRAGGAVDIPSETVLIVDGQTKVPLVIREFSVKYQHKFFGRGKA